ncbi:J domain-containing protein [Paraburkholderia fungorum]|uniref:J domain-containing protein n=1 Tax=Paraburkholderia fungorum TaxID=134537 RepID=UPI0038B94FB7
MPMRIPESPAAGSAAGPQSDDARGKTHASQADTPRGGVRGAVMAGLSGLAGVQQRMAGGLRQADVKLRDTFRSARVQAKAGMASARTASQRFFGFPRPLGGRFAAGWQRQGGGYGPSYSAFTQPMSGRMRYGAPLLSGLGGGMAMLAGYGVGMLGVSALSMSGVGLLPLLVGAAAFSAMRRASLARSAQYGCGYSGNAVPPNGQYGPRANTWGPSWGMPPPDAPQTQRGRRGTPPPGDSSGARRQPPRDTSSWSNRGGATGRTATPPPEQRREVPAWAAVLGVSPDADEQAIQAAHRALSKEHHPDLGGDGQGMSEINVARDDALKDIKARKAADGSKDYDLAA